MDWTNRDVKPSAEPSGAGVVATAKHSRGRAPRTSGMLRIAFVLFLFAATILVVSSVIYLAIGGRNIKEENKYVDTKKMQAVFLNGGQVYFGNITALNNKYINLTNIYYLRVNQSVQPADQNNANNVSLVKLGCELHGPIDQMTINREQVVFWENLKTDGQVAKAVTQYVKDNPSGPKCDTTTSSTSNSATTPASTSTTKK